MKVNVSMWSSVLLVSLLASTLGLIVSCSTTHSNEKELDVATLDPNAPALPPEPTATPEAEAIAAVPTPMPSSAVKEATTTPPPATVAQDTPVTTPKVDELLNDGDDDSGEPIGTLDDSGHGDSGKKERVASEDDDNYVAKKPKTLKPRVGNPDGSPRVFGTGKQKRFIKADQLHIRVQPDRYSKSIGIIYGGDEVHVTIRGDWAKLEEGQWIRSRWLVKTAPRKFRSDDSSSSGNASVKKKKKKTKRKSKP